MLPNTLTISAADAQTANDLVLTKRSEQSGTSLYTGSYTSGANLREVEVEIRHTRPKDKSSKGSSLLKLSIHRFNDDGTFQKTIRAWTVTESPYYSGGQANFAESLLKAISADSTLRTEYFDGSY